jgi:hypothetical protein
LKKELAEGQLYKRQEKHLMTQETSDDKIIFRQAKEYAGRYTDREDLRQTGEHSDRYTDTDDLAR